MDAETILEQRLRQRIIEEVTPKYGLVESICPLAPLERCQYPEYVESSCKNCQTLASLIRKTPARFDLFANEINETVSRWLEEEARERLKEELEPVKREVSDYSDERIKWFMNTSFISKIIREARSSLVGDSMLADLPDETLKTISSLDCMIKQLGDCEKTKLAFEEAIKATLDSDCRLAPSFKSEIMENIGIIEFPGIEEL